MLGLPARRLPLFDSDGHRIFHFPGHRLRPLDPRHGARRIFEHTVQRVRIHSRWTVSLTHPAEEEETFAHLNGRHVHDGEGKARDRRPQIYGQAVLLGKVGDQETEVIS